MNTKLIKAAEGVIAAAMQQGKSLPINFAIALESAQLLQSPETAAEHERVRAERDSLREQRAQLAERNALLLAELESMREDRERPADEDPICYALTPAAHALASAAHAVRSAADGITRRIAPTQALAADTGGDR